MRYLWGFLSVAIVVTIVSFLAHAGVDVVADLLFAMLGGAVVGAFASITLSFRSTSALPGPKIIFVSIVGAAVSLFIAGVLLKITTVSLFGTAAMVFDLLIGVIGATTALTASTLQHAAEP